MSIAEKNKMSTTKLKLVYDWTGVLKAEIRQRDGGIEKKKQNEVKIGDFFWEWDMVYLAYKSMRSLMEL